MRDTVVVIYARLREITHSVTIEGYFRLHLPPYFLFRFSRKSRTLKYATGGYGCGPAPFCSYNCALTPIYNQPRLPKHIAFSWVTTRLSLHDFFGSG